ncbi:hypothetical protein [Xaviernesmea oryzae]|uniref:DUF2188 domain-containing protein n=1 Tax=Xaviernesmea oryzae TaxID=464029 RepID=A0A1X7FT28_9HYPH|nr:hypothetical protein [Xaviernesmea oryzae]SMF58319.1 hypothetical protein SAMN02982989_0727 [Xaviernesmea oryzae]
MPSTKKALSVVVRSDGEGHWVEWTHGDEAGSLGPYQDSKMADDVRTAKEREFSENKRHITDV